MNDSVQLAGGAAVALSKGGLGGVSGTSGVAGDPSVLCASHPLWKAMVEPMLPSSDVSAGNWLTGRTAPAASARLPCAVSGEWVYLSVDVHNPSPLSLDVSNVRLRCEVATAEGVGGSRGRGAEGSSSLAVSFSVSVSSVSSVELDSQHLTLSSGALAVVRLGVKPLVAEGELRILGVEWELESCLKGEHALVLTGQRLNGTKKQRTGREYAFVQSLRFSLTPPMPVCFTNAGYEYLRSSTR